MCNRRELSMACLFALLMSATTSLAQSQNDDTQAQQACPLFLRGSKLSVSEIDGGVQVTITTSKQDSVHAVRTMTHTAASYIESNEVTRRLPPLALTVTDIRDGAKLSVKAENASDVASLRQEAKNLAEAWRTDDCINGDSAPHEATKMPAIRGLRT